MVEMIQLDHPPMFGAEWTVGWDGGGPGIAVWDLTKAWDAAGQPRGVVAAHIPQMPHFIRFDEVAAGRSEPRRLLRPARCYGPGRTGYARASDGKDSTVPLRAGNASASPTLHSDGVVAARGESSMEATTVATGLRTHGAVLDDTGSTPSFIATQDPAGSSSDGVASASASPTSRSSPNPDQEVTTMNEQTRAWIYRVPSPPSPS